MAGAGEVERERASQWVCGAGVLAEQQEAFAVYVDANRFYGRRDTEQASAGTADLVCDSGASAGRAVVDQSLSVWRQERLRDAAGEISGGLGVAGEGAEEVSVRRAFYERAAATAGFSTAVE